MLYSQTVSGEFLQKAVPKLREDPLTFEQCCRLGIGTVFRAHLISHVHVKESADATCDIRDIVRSFAIVQQHSTEADL